MKLSIIIVIVYHLMINVDSQMSFLEKDQGRLSSLFKDYLYTLTNNLKWTEKNIILRIYLGSSTQTVTGMIIRKFCSLKDKRSIVISTTEGNFMKRTVSEKIGIAIANDEKDLKKFLNVLYFRSQHDYYVVCVTYPVVDVVKNLTQVTLEIWTKGMPMNMFFVVMSIDRNAIVILRAPSYAEGTCKEGDLVEVGFVKHRNYTSIRDNFLARFDDLGGCKLNIMVQPPFVPYIDRRTSDPGGIIGMLVAELSKYLNFTPTYTWAYSRQQPLKHYRANNLNIVFDLLPTSLMPIHKFSFTFGLVNSAFVVPRSLQFSDSTNLLNPFHSWVWICLAGALSCLTIFSYFKSKFDFMYIFVKTVGVLLGVGGQIPKSPWIKLLFWGWLLPAYILQQSYLASLMKNMAIAEPTGDINTVKHLIDSGMDIVCSPETRMNFCRTSSANYTDGFYLCLLCREVKDKYIFKRLYPAAMTGKVINNTAFIANEEVIKFTRGYRFVRFVRGSSVAMPQTVAVRPGNPYIFQIYTIFSRCFEGGLFEYWKRRKRPSKYKKLVTFVEIVNDKLQKCFDIIFIGWMASCLAFFGEILVYHREKMRTLFRKLYPREMRFWDGSTRST